MFKSSSLYTASLPPPPSNCVRNNNYKCKVSYTTVTSPGEHLVSPREHLVSPREHMVSPREHLVSPAASSFHHSFCRSPFNVKISQINCNYLHEPSLCSPANMNSAAFPSESKFSSYQRHNNCVTSGSTLQPSFRDIDCAMKRLNIRSDSQSQGTADKGCGNIGGYPDQTSESELNYCCTPEVGVMKPRVVIHYMPHRTFETPVFCTCVPALIDSRKTMVESTRQKTPKAKRTLPKTSTPAKIRRKLPKASTPGRTRRILPHASSPVTSSSLTKSRRKKNIKTTYSMTDLSSFRTTQANFLESLKNTYEMADVLDGHATKKNKTSLKKKILRPYRALRQKFSQKSDEPRMESDQPYFRSNGGLSDFEFQYV
ncbi:hypothetical protein ACHWQZ_G002356 [Mnemiopsis leidyi]